MNDILNNEYFEKIINSLEDKTMTCGECYEKIKDNENYIKYPNCKETYHVGCEGKKCKYCKTEIR